MQASKHAGMQASMQASRQASMQAGRQSGKHASKQTCMQASIVVCCIEYAMYHIGVCIVVRLIVVCRIEYVLVWHDIVVFDGPEVDLTLGEWQPCAKCM